MRAGLFPEAVPNWVEGRECPALSGELLEKLDPARGRLLCRAARSVEADVKGAVAVAKKRQPSWAELTPVRRGEILYAVAAALEERREQVARVVAEETGKSYRLALGETDGAIALGRFMAGEG